MKRLVTGIAVVAVCAGVVGVTAVVGRHGSSNTAPPGVLASIVDSPIAHENALKGTSSWRLRGVRSSHPVEGYANRTSIAAGETLDVYVRTRANTIHAEIYRMGYYGGAGGRRVGAIPTMPGDPQSGCPVSIDRRRTVSCTWTRSFQVRTNTAWVSGVFMIKLIGSDETQSYVPFVVREASPSAPIVFQASVTTWQAYNAWGGRNQYAGPCEKRRTTPVSASSPVAAAPASRGSPRVAASPEVSIIPTARPSITPLPSPSPSPSAAPSPSASPSPKQRTYTCGTYTRSRATSFDRPYKWPGDGQFFRFEYPMLNWLESQGMWMAYSTDIDLHEGTSALSARKVFLSVGHDEYYSTAMRRGLDKALAGGTSLGFFGGNDMYRHIRLEPSPLGPDRIQVNYKSAAEDPLIRTNRPEVTTQWREWPLYEPEQALLGAQYECNPVRAPWVATGTPEWLFRGTGLAAGDSIEDLVGYEYDRVMPGYKSPPNVVLVADSPVRCGGRRTVSNSTFYIAPSGASVFDAGTLWFTCGLGPGGCTNAQDPHMKPDPRLQRLVRNLIYAMLSKRYG